MGRWTKTGAPKLPANCTQDEKSFKRFPLMDDECVFILFNTYDQ